MEKRIKLLCLRPLWIQPIAKQTNHSEMLIVKAILSVDDFTTMLPSLTSIIVKAGYTAQMAASGDEALGKLKGTDA